MPPVISVEPHSLPQFTFILFDFETNEQLGKVKVNYHLDNKLTDFEQLKQYEFLLKAGEYENGLNDELRWKMTDKFTIIHPETLLMDVFQPKLPSDYGVIYVSNTIPNNITEDEWMEYIKEPLYEYEEIFEKTTEEITDESNMKEEDMEEEDEKEDDDDFGVLIGVGILYMATVSGLLYYAISKQLNWHLEL